jgi:mRNA interferase RelE/StbE
VTRWSIDLTREAREQLLAISDRRIRETILERINQLTFEPDKQGKPMRNDLIGFRSIRAVGQRYRILYKVYEERVVVLVVALGIRKEGDKQDAYQLAKKLKRQGLLDL